MMLPLDFRYVSRPIKAKYICEETPGLDEWVVAPSQDGLCAIYQSGGGKEDIMINVPADLAEAIVAARNAWSRLNLDLVNGRYVFSMDVMARVLAGAFGAAHMEADQ